MDIFFFHFFLYNSFMTPISDLFHLFPCLLQLKSESVERKNRKKIRIFSVLSSGCPFFLGLRTGPEGGPPLPTQFFLPVFAGEHQQWEGWELS